MGCSSLVRHLKPVSGCLSRMSMCSDLLSGVMSDMCMRACADERVTRGYDGDFGGERHGWSESRETSEKVVI